MKYISWLYKPVLNWIILPLKYYHWGSVKVDFIWIPNGSTASDINIYGKVSIFNSSDMNRQYRDFAIVIPHEYFMINFFDEVAHNYLEVASKTEVTEKFSCILPRNLALRLFENREVMRIEYKLSGKTRTVKPIEIRYPVHE